MVPKIGAKMPEIPLFPSCLQPHMSVMHAQMHMHVCTCIGATPNLPYPHKKFEGPNPIGSRDMTHYVIGCKTSNFLVKV